MISKWLDTFISEKNLDLETTFEIISETETWNLIPLGCVVEAIKSAPNHEQKAIRTMIVKIDFVNGDVMDFFKHLAQAIAL